MEQFIINKLGSTPHNFKLGKYTRWGKNNRYWALVKDGYCVCGDFVENVKFSMGNIDTKYVPEYFDPEKIINIWRKIVSTQETTPYLISKGVKKCNYAKLSWDAVYVPYLSFKYPLCAIQEIGHNGSKRFIKGSRVQGAMALPRGLTRDGKPIYLVEGYATGMSLNELIDDGYIVIAGSSTNVRQVYNNLRMREYNNITGIPDNDDASYEAFSCMPIIKLPTVLTGHDVNDVIKYNKERLKWTLTNLV